jgi:hypothetical protein
MDHGSRNPDLVLAFVEVLVLHPNEEGLVRGSDRFALAQ